MVHTSAGSAARAGALSATLHTAAFTELDAATLYQLLRLRVDVFVVEQRCCYPELDGRDLEPATRHCWVASQGQVLAYLRVLAQPDDGWRIGRVATAAHARGQGHARRLVRHALDVAGRPVVLHAQPHAVGFYATFGFTPEGPLVVEDGVPHQPMRLQ